MSATTRWEESLSVGVDTIDVDHRRLVAMLDELYGAVGADDSKAVLARTVSSLLDYSREHFRDEEAVMRRHAYPEIRKHAAEHQDLLRKLSEIKNKVDGGEVDLTLEVMDFLGGWLTGHILGADKRLGIFLQADEAR